MNVYINDGKNIPAEDETCFIIAKGGIYLKKKLDLIESITPVDKISFLEDLVPFAKLNIPKIPAKIFGSILAFFKEVYVLYKSEAIVLLFYNKSTKKYKIHIPEQIVGSASVEYKANMTIKDHILIGTIHSHSSMSAFHSTTDVNDEEKFDGIHITIGKVDNKEIFDVCSSIAVNGMRVPVVPESYIEGIQLTEYTPYFPNMFKPSFITIGEEKIYSKTVKSSSGYVLTESNLDHIYYKKEWLDKVKEKEYKYIPNQNSFNLRTNIFDSSKFIKISDINDRNEKICTENSYICSSCAHRDEKLSMKKMKKIEDKDCKNNFETDYSDYDNHLWW